MVFLYKAGFISAAFMAFLALSSPVKADMTVDPNGSVGIGTEDPDGYSGPTLHIKKGDSGGTGNTEAVLTLESDLNVIEQILLGTTSTFDLQVGDSDSNHQGRLRFGAGGDYASLWTAGSEAMRIDSNGNVSIGAGAPSAKLAINDDGSVDGMHLRSIGSAVFKLFSDTDNSGPGDSKFAMGTDGGTTAQWTFGLDSSNSNAFTLANSDNDLNSNARMVIETGGNVGIGVTNPAYTLHVNGNIGTTNSGAVHSDYVFESDYELRSLEELESFIKKEKHLPGIITDPEKTPVVDVMALNGKFLEKIEELTLYVIALNKENEQLKTRLELLEGGQK